MLKISTILGARPQFIKASVVSKAFQASGKIKEAIIHTGQHFDANMSEIFFEQMQIPKPSYNLNIHGGNHGEMTGNMLAGIEKILLAEKPDWVLVYGDTNSTLAGALAASKLHIPVAHVEAGLRSFNVKMPEEVNRILTDRVSSLLFCPSKTAEKNLKAEGFDAFDCKTLNVGDVMYDAALQFAKLNPLDTSIQNIIKSGKQFILATIHRAENTDDPERLKSIFKALEQISSQVNVVMPLHPRTKYCLEKCRLNPAITFIDPLGYIDMLHLIKHSAMVITDSGGLQKEAYFFKKFCITARNETEWLELVEHGCNAVVGSNADKLTDQFEKFYHQKWLGNIKLYGDGQASDKICRELLNA